MFNNIIYLYKIMCIFTQMKILIHMFTSYIYPSFFTGLSYINFSNCDIFAISIIVSTIFYILNNLILLIILILKTFTYYYYFNYSRLTIWFKKSAFVICISIFVFKHVSFKLFRKIGFFFFYLINLFFNTMFPLFL